MFRDGQYLEVIKASDNCLATVVVTVQEKTIEIKKQKIITNKWLQVEDWVALYKILKRAILRNSQDNGSHYEARGCEWKKSTQQFEVTYTFEHPECASDTTSLPTIKVHVSPARKKSVKREKNSEISKDNKVKARDDTAKRMKEDKSSDRITETKSNRLKKPSEQPTQALPKKIETLHVVPTEQEDSRKTKKRKYSFSNVSLEEYIPDASKIKKCIDLKYIPSQKSVLESMPLAMNEYTPTLCDSKRVLEDVNYVPNSIEKLKATYEIYEPCTTTTISTDILREYVPNSKGMKSSIEEYEPDFKSPSKPMKFDDSYVPSSVRQNTPNDFKRINADKSGKLKTQKIEVHRKVMLSKKKMNLFS